MSILNRLGIGAVVVMAALAAISPDETREWLFEKPWLPEIKFPELKPR